MVEPAGYICFFFKYQINPAIFCCENDIDLAQRKLKRFLAHTDHSLEYQKEYDSNCKDYRNTTLLLVEFQIKLSGQ